jgi:hypothetical protein
MTDRTPQNRRTRSLATSVTILVALTLAGCGSSLPPHQTTEIEGVPAPLDAVELVEEREQDTRVYSVPTMTATELAEWYDVLLPIDRDFGDWEFCGFVTETYGDAIEVLRVYRKGSVGALYVIVVDDYDGTLVGVTNGEYAREARDEYC